MRKSRTYTVESDTAGAGSVSIRRFSFGTVYISRLSFALPLNLGFCSIALSRFHFNYSLSARKNPYKCSPLETAISAGLYLRHSIIDLIVFATTSISLLLLQVQQLLGDLLWRGPLPGQGGQREGDFCARQDTFKS